MNLMPALARLSRLAGTFALACALAAVAAPVAGCGGGDKNEAKAPAKEAALDDALALLPGSPILVGTVDARAFFSSQHFGADLARLVEKYMPIGQESGFLASRDVDRVTFASYSYQGVDVAAVVVGRFDPAKIKQVAEAHSPTKSGGYLVMSQYAGRDLYTINNIGFTLLSEQRAIVGTESGIRRVLERIQDGRVQRDIQPWMLGTVETSGAALALAADFSSQPIPAETMASIPGALTQGAKAARVLGVFKEGVQLAGSVTYGESTKAEAAAGELRKYAAYTTLLSGIGVQVRGFEAKVEQNDVQLTVSVDDQSLRALVASVAAFVAPPQ